MAKRRIIWSVNARIDLIEILDFYYHRNGTKTYSRKLQIRIIDSISLLENFGEMGTQTDIKDIRHIIEGHIGIFYEVKATSIEIITVWDHRQDPESLKI